MRRFVVLLVTTTFAAGGLWSGAAMGAALAAPAAGVALQQQTEASLEEAAEALRRDSVYVDPSAERAISSSEADDLRDAIRAQGAAVFIAVLPESMAPTAEEAGELLVRLRQR